MPRREKIVTHMEEFLLRLYSEQISILKFPIIELNPDITTQSTFQACQCQLQLPVHVCASAQRQLQEVILWQLMWRRQPINKVQRQRRLLVCRPLLTTVSLQQLLMVKFQQLLMAKFQRLQMIIFQRRLLMVKFQQLLMVTFQQFLMVKF